MLNQALMGLGPYTPPMKISPTRYLICNNWDEDPKGIWVTPEEFARITLDRPDVRVLCTRFDDGERVSYQLAKEVADRVFANPKPYELTHHPGLAEFMDSKLCETHEVPMNARSGTMTEQRIGGLPSKEWIQRMTKLEEGHSVECGYRHAMNAGFAKLYGQRESVVMLDEAAFPRPVLSKKDYYARYILGEFGNRLQVWADQAGWEASGFTGAIGIRNRKPDSPYCRYDIPHRLVKSVVAEFLAKGCPASDMTFNEAAPDSALILQGEFMRLPSGLELTYSTVKRQMRIALKERPQYASRSAAVAILKHVMDTASYEWCEYLLDAYPDHAIEFSTYSINLGNQNRNTLIWEVRKY